MTSPAFPPDRPPLRLAVHLHIYYADMWPQIRKYLAHLAPYPYHLYLTMVEPHAELVEQIRAFHAETTAYVVENRGYDIGPFIHFLHRIDLKDYDLILKIHTKNSTSRQLIHLKRYAMTRQWWARLLYTSLLGSHKQAMRNIDLFCRYPRVGMVGSLHLITSHKRDLVKVEQSLQEGMHKMGYRRWRFRFVAGSMFMVRSAIMQPLKDHYRLEDFEPPSGSMVDGSRAHMIERAFGCVTTAQGYEIRGCAWNPLFECSSLLHTIRDFIYKKRITTSNRLIIKICRIPIINRSLPK